MPRLCERPGCSTPADVAYGFDAESLTVWLDGFDAAQGSRAGALCRRHADAMVVPLGWMLDDRREPVPRLFNRASMDDLTDGMSRPRARRSKSDRTIEMLRRSVEQLTLDQMGRDELATSGGVHEVAPVAVEPVGSVGPVASVEPVEPDAAAPADLEPDDVEAAEPDDVEPDAVEPDGVEPAAPQLVMPAYDPVDHSGPMAIVVALLDAPEPEPTRDGDEIDETAPTDETDDETDDETKDETDDETDTDGKVLAWQPRFDQQDDLSGLLKPRGRLLSRAFRGITADGA